MIAGTTFDALKTRAVQYLATSSVLTRKDFVEKVCKTDGFNPVWVESCLDVLVEVYPGTKIVFGKDV